MAWTMGWGVGEGNEININPGLEPNKRDMFVKKNSA